MNANPPVKNQPPATRREFLKTSSAALAGATLSASFVPHVHSGVDETIKVALVGCGGRGTGAAANALSTQGSVKLWALADVFPDRVKSSSKNLQAQYKDRTAVTPDRQFVGFDAFKKAIDSLDKNDLVILATPPAFRPRQLEYAIEKGVNVFMEKSFAVDAPGIRRVLMAGKRAEEKNLKIAGGLMSRHSPSLEKAVTMIHEGQIGDIITCYAYRMHGPVGFSRARNGKSELAHQIGNYSCFTWLNGSFIVDWLIHNIDVCCWAKDAWPESVQGMGGRETRRQPDQLYDHYGAEYTFPDGTRMMAQGRHINHCWNFFGDVIHGTTGSAVLGEGIPKPRIFKGHNSSPDNLIWQPRGSSKNPYQVEHDLLFDAIRRNTPYNETERCAQACMTAIMGRMACESGKRITRKEAMESNLELAPGLDNINALDAPAPVLPNEEGQYPVAVPGMTKVV